MFHSILAIVAVANPDLRKGLAELGTAIKYYYVFVDLSPKAVIDPL